LLSAGELMLRFEFKGLQLGQYNMLNSLKLL
jgi:hypothetical protein